MKEFIVMMALLPITIILIATPLRIETNFAKENLAREEVYDMVSDAAQQGYFKQSSLDNFKEKMAEIMGCNEDEIRISVSNNVVYRPNVINYEFEIPLRNALPGNRFFGISDAKNIKTINISGSIVSERLVNY